MERTFAIAWMNNWNYADAVQQKGYIGQLSLVRELRLQLVDGTAIMQNRPVEAVRSLSGANIPGKQQTVSDEHDYDLAKRSGADLLRDRSDQVGL